MVVAGQSCGNARARIVYCAEGAPPAGAPMPARPGVVGVSPRWGAEGWGASTDGPAIPGELWVAAGAPSPGALRRSFGARKLNTTTATSAMRAVTRAMRMARLSSRWLDGVVPGDGAAPGRLGGAVHGEAPVFHEAPRLEHRGTATVRRMPRSNVPFNSAKRPSASPGATTAPTGTAASPPRR